jgi:hypothetical protein
VWTTQTHSPSRLILDRIPVPLLAGEKFLLERVLLFHVGSFLAKEFMVGAIAVPGAKWQPAVCFKWCRVASCSNRTSEVFRAVDMAEVREPAQATGAALPPILPASVVNGGGTYVRPRRAADS